MTDEVSSSPICRICHERSTNLIRPCNCRGTVEYVHASCIQTWLNHRRPDEMRCELCGYPFRLRVRTRSPLWFFLPPGGWRHWLHVVYICFVARRMWLQVEVVTKVLHKLPRRSWSLIWRLFLHCFMIGHYAVFLSFDIKYLLRRWLRWRHLTSELVVYGKSQP
mmetsp:Transcript_8363/g.25134  ORF Transcript_8363/g.25134 Transcript_8363/m.25134 type:complete len:164 (+) Transcript_8363:107-598(+)